MYGLFASSTPTQPPLVVPLLGALSGLLGYDFLSRRRNVLSEVTNGRNLPFCVVLNMQTADGDRFDAWLVGNRDESAATPSPVLPVAAAFAAVTLIRDTNAAALRTPGFV